MTMTTVQGEKGEKMPTINIKDVPESKIVKLVDLSEDSINKIAEAVVRKIVNAEPMRHGTWINISISANGNESSAECDLCGARVHNNFSSVINYCPNCGAKMDEVTDEADKC